MVNDIICDCMCRMQESDVIAAAIVKALQFGCKDITFFSDWKIIKEKFL